MFPLSDTIPATRRPWINYLIIILNVVVFYLQFASGDPDGFIDKYAFAPAKFSFTDITSYQAVLASTFMHGNLFHIISNMWFLKIFGDNVEGRLGHLKYGVFYLLAGFAAALAQYFAGPNSIVPMIGASGAVAGVAGAYFVWFRDSRVKTLLFLFVFVTIIELRASIVLGYWFLTQLINGFGYLAAATPNQGGVAFFAHVGGFIFGYLAAKVYSPRAE